MRVFVLQCNAHTVFEDWLLRSPAVLLLFACNVPLALQAHPKVCSPQSLGSGLVR